MNPPIWLYIALWGVLFYQHSNAQVYHYQTGKILPASQPGSIIWNSGTFNGYQANFGTLIVKENSFAPKSKVLNIPVIHIPSFNYNTSAEPIYLLYGGPGESNLRTELINSKLLVNHDLILVGYRGVDGSIKLDCPTDSSFFNNWNSIYTNFYQACSVNANRCIANFVANGTDVSGYSMSEVVNDIYLVSRALEHKSISFLSYSYGTLLAQYFAQLHPEIVKSMTMIAARPLGNFAMDSEPFEQQISAIFYYHTGKNLSMQQIDSLFRSVQTFDGYNLPKFYLFAFSSLYSSESAKLFCNNLYNYKSNPLPIMDQYDKFFNHFPGQITLADMILKKQGFKIEYNTNWQDSVIPDLLLSVNSWYFPIQNPEIEPINYKLAHDSLQVLIINGEYDIASPPQLMESEYLSQKENLKFFVIPQSTHLDFFTVQKPITDSLISDFYR